MKSIFNDSTLETFKKIRQVFLKVIVGIIIGEIILLAILIIAQSASKVIGQFMGTLLILAIALFIAMSCFRCIEKKQPVAQVLSLVALFAEVFWFIFQTLELWEVIPLYEVSLNSSSVYGFAVNMTGVAKFATIVSNIMLYSLFGAWISSIEENGGPIKPLKITALSCDIYIWVFSLIVLFAEFSSSAATTVFGLYGLAWVGLIVTWCIASSISRKNKKEQLDRVIDSKNITNSEEMQAQIREMVEKEVQARMTAEKEGIEEKKEME